MKKMTALLLLFVAILFTSCGEKNTEEVTPSVKHVLVAGEISNNENVKGSPCLWKDGVAFPLTKPDVLGYAYDLCVVDDVIYVAGNVFENNNRKAVYWRNGEMVILSNTVSEATGIAVDGKDIYISGHDYSENYYTPFYYKNGIRYDLPLHSDPGYEVVLLDIKVRNGKVYIAALSLSDRFQAYCYEDGVGKTLSESDSYIYSVYLNGNDVYYAGAERSNNDNYVATYWKNGVATALSDGSNDASANAIVMSGQDVFVAGTEELPNGNAVAKLWKNGVATILPSNSGSVEVTSMYLDGDDLYITGYEGNTNGELTHAILWKNGEIMPLAGSENNGTANSVVVYASTKSTAR